MKVCHTRKPSNAKTGRVVGSIWMVIRTVTGHVKAVPRNSSSSSEAAAEVRRHFGSFFSDMSSYVSAWCS